MDEKSKTHEHRSLAFETVPPRSGIHLSEIIVEPSIGSSLKNSSLRIISRVLSILLLSGIAWFTYEYMHASAVIESNEAKINKLSLANLLKNPALVAYARETAAPLFVEHCSNCHGAGGEGHQTERGLFAPVLNDKDWMFDPQVESIYAAIANGSQSLMPAFRRKLSGSEIENVAKFVKAMSEGQGNKEPLGKRVFENAGCKDCHGEDAKGSKSIGAVNLTDSIWRFEGTLDGIRRTITYGVNSGDTNDRVASMPSFSEGGKLSKSEMKKLTIYVYKLSDPVNKK